MTNAEQFRAEAQQMYAKARTAVSYLTAGLPDKAYTPGQQKLAEKHGTPLKVAESIIKAVGEISIDEAEAAVTRYLHQWEAAQ